MLNPMAPAFVPSYEWALPVDAREARNIDDAMACLHHLVTANDTEVLLEAEEWLGKDPAGWEEAGLEYSYADDACDDVGYALDHEDRLRDNLYHAPNKARGDTRGRARVRH